MIQEPGEAVRWVGQREVKRGLEADRRRPPACQVATSWQPATDWHGSPKEGNALLWE
jgi:hypothetical protein